MELLVVLAVLICPLVMGGMMLRMRGHGPRDREDDQQ